MANLPHLLLAAGNSSRMGQAKQLLPWGDKTLIEHQIQIRLKTKQNVVVVLGSQADKILPFIEKLHIGILYNNEWAKGMGNSLAFGIKKLNRIISDVDGVLISLLDQPLITTAHLEKILQSYQIGYQQIIVSQADSGWQGVPALFDKFYMNELEKLNGEEGARGIIQKHIHHVKSIACGNLLDDIDTPEAYEKLLKRYI